MPQNQVSTQRPFFSAALRHLRDAETLLDVGPRQSPDQAYHLVGFAVECAKKGGLSVDWADKAMGHSLDLVDPWLEELILAVDAPTRRAPHGLTLDPNGKLSQWRPTVRYDETGKHNAKEVEGAVREAQAAVYGLIGDRWAAGLYN
ncbi:MAG: hypothetical protein RIT28_3607, partial [Pseudomonadota bacterium]